MVDSQAAQIYLQSRLVELTTQLEAANLRQAPQPGDANAQPGSPLDEARASLAAALEREGRLVAEREVQTQALDEARGRWRRR